MSKNFIKELQELIAVSLHIKPCKIKELKQRDFLKNISITGIDVCLHSLENKGAIKNIGKLTEDLDEQKIGVYKSYMKKAGLLTKYQLE